MSDPPRRDTRLPWRETGVILAAVWLIFGRTVSFGFVWDDILVLVQNPLFNPPTSHTVVYFFTHLAWNLYMPVTCAVWAALAGISYATSAELNPAVFHAGSVTLHAAASVMAFLVLDKLLHRRLPALAGGLVFAIHPIQVEAVAFVGAINNPLYGVLSLFAIWLYLNAATDERAAHRRGFYLLSLLAFAMALLAKPAAVVMPAVVATLDLFLLRRPVNKVIRSVLPWVLLAIPAALAAKLFQHGVESAGSVPAWFRIFVASDAVAFYVAKILLPFHFTIDYGRTPFYLCEYGWPFITWILPAGLMLAAVMLCRRGMRLPLAGLLIFFLPLAPNSGLLPFDFQQFSTTADRYAYLAMFGIAILVAGGVSAVKTRPSQTICRTVAGCAIALLATRAFILTNIWQNDVTLMSHAVSENPNGALIRSNLAAALMNDSPAEALAHARVAVKLRPGDPKMWETLGMAGTLAGRAKEAAGAYARIVAMKPASADARHKLARSLGDAGRTAEAITEYERAAQQSPNDAAIQIDFAATLAEAGRFDEARKHYQAALTLDPTSTIARTGMTRLEKR